MKNFHLLSYLFFLASFSGEAQNRHSLFLNAGYTYNTKITINDQEVKNSEGLLLTIGGLYKVYSYKSFYTEIGLAGKTIFASGEVNEKRFNSRTLRLAVPVKLNYKLSPKWEGTGGFIFQNNTDLSKLDLRLRDKYSWRVDFLAEVKYILNEQWFVTTGLKINLRKIPHSYLINDPADAFLIGVGRRIKWLRKEKIKKTW